MDLMKIGAIAMRIVSLLPTFVAAVDKIKGAKGADKKQAVIDSIDDFIQMAEVGYGKDFLNDAAILALRDAAIDAEAAALKARNAYKMGLLNKAQAEGA